MTKATIDENDVIKLKTPIFGYRFEVRSYRDVIAQNGYHPLVRGRPYTPPLGNIPHHLLFPGELSHNPDYKERDDPRTALNIDDPRKTLLPTNPGANLNSVCLATIPNGAIASLLQNASHKAYTTTKIYYMGVVVITEGYPITALYQTQEMLKKMLENSATAVNSGHQSLTQRILLSYDKYGHIIYTLNYPVIINNEIVNSFTLNVIADTEQGKQEGYVGFLVPAIQKKLFFITENNHCIGYYKNDRLYNNAKREIGKFIKSNIAVVDNKRVKGNLVERHIHINKRKAFDKANLSILINDADNLNDQEKGYLHSELSLAKIREFILNTKTKEFKEATYEFEFSSKSVPLENIFLWAKVEILNPLSYKILGYEFNNKFNFKKFPQVYTDDHFKDLIKALKTYNKTSKPATVTTIPENFKTRLQNIFINLSPTNYLLMESMIRDTEAKKSHLNKIRTILSKENFGIDAEKNPDMIPESVDPSEISESLNIPTSSNIRGKIPFLSSFTSAVTIRR